LHDTGRSVAALSLDLIHRSAWNGFCELRIDGVLSSLQKMVTWHTKTVHLGIIRRAAEKRRKDRANIAGCVWWTGTWA
jgi:hypothetical protein